MADDDATSPVSNVSDTASWVASYRAIETRRADAIFKDPLAERLAGEKGRAIVARAAKHMHNGWPVIARTKVIDDMVLECVANGCDCVLNLAAGLDTRPYRLDLPQQLHWVEADLPGIIEEKTALLAGERPHCHLERVKVDLADASARARFLDGAVGEHKRVLVLTEGLVMYLEDETVRELSRDLERPGIAWWILDSISPAVLKGFMRNMSDLGRAPMHFAPAHGVAFFEDLGWQVAAMRSLVAEAKRLHRLPWHLYLIMLLPFPQPDPRNLGTAMWSAVVQLHRAPPAG
ncbi:MAG: SAM-dependent methyltransferase [Hyphomicrobium sp.]|jgi:methyltransferase (TIGR00027 family)